MNKPAVTVIIPNYNHARYLPERIESVLNQTCQDIEVLLMDDCSKDDSRRVIADYAARDSRIRVVLNEQNSGSTFKQWNKGIALAKGEYIWIAESDDVADLTFLEKLLALLDANPAAGLAYSQSWRIDENGQPHGTWAPIMAELDATLWESDFVLPGPELVRRFMIHSNIIPNASAVVMRRSALAAVGPAPETMRIAGDWVYWVRYMLTTQVAFVAEPLNYFRFHRHNVRSSTEQDGTQLLEIAQAMGFVKSQLAPEPVLYQKTIEQMIERWLRGVVYYQMPVARHRQFLRLMTVVEPTFKAQAAKKFLHFLVRNRFSGTKMLIGDKLLGRHLRKQNG
jgi:cellulose synthase/poly-beta-1,6-N-acetylglucosamine synthase-like glycosyltransferase